MRFEGRLTLVEYATVFLLLISMAVACKSPSAAILDDQTSVKTLQKFDFDCVGFRAPDQVAVSGDGRLLLVVGDCKGNETYAGVSVFDMDRKRAIRAWSAQRPSMHLSQDPVLVRLDNEVWIVTIQSDVPGLDVETDFICVDKFYEDTIELAKMPCVQAGRLGLLAGADVNTASGELMIQELSQFERRLWRIQIAETGATTKALFDEKVTQSTDLNMAEYKVGDARFAVDGSVLVLMIKRADFGTPESHHWKMLRINTPGSQVAPVEHLTQAETVDCQAWLTPTGLIGNPWSFTQFRDTCALTVFDDTGEFWRTSKILSEPAPRERGVGFMAAAQTDCCLLLYSRQRNRVELFDWSSGQAYALVDCSRLPQRRCGQVFALNSPGQFVTVHGQVAYRFGLDRNEDSGTSR